MTTYTSHWIYIGNFADLDTNDSNTVVENASTLLGTTFSTANNPDMQLLSVTYSEPEHDNFFTTNNNGQTADSVSYDTGSGTQSSGMDSHWDYSADVHLSDGSTITRTLGMVQLENGHLFINGDNLNNLSIVSFTPTSIVDSGYQGFGGSRNIANSSITCFASGTLIECEHGPKKVQHVKVGDRVTTVDRGFQEVRWVSHRKITAEEMATNPAFTPVRICADALGVGIPYRDLIVSQQHRILVKSKIAAEMFGTGEVLIAAKHLVELDGIEYANDIHEIYYIHFVCNQHELIIAEGAITESLYTGLQALMALDEADKIEIFTIFPNLLTDPNGDSPPRARQFAQGKMGKKMIARHKENKQELFADHAGCDANLLTPQLH